MGRRLAPHRRGHLQHHGPARGCCRASPAAGIRRVNFHPYTKDGSSSSAGPPPSAAASAGVRCCLHAPTLSRAATAKPPPSPPHPPPPPPPPLQPQPHLHPPSPPSLHPFHPPTPSPPPPPPAPQPHPPPPPAPSSPSSPSSPPSPSSPSSPSGPSSPHPLTPSSPSHPSLTQDRLCNLQAFEGWARLPEGGPAPEPTLPIRPDPAATRSPSTTSAAPTFGYRSSSIPSCQVASVSGDVRGRPNLPRGVADRRAHRRRRGLGTSTRRLAAPRFTKLECWSLPCTRRSTRAPSRPPPPSSPASSRPPSSNGHPLLWHAQLPSRPPCCCQPPAPRRAVATFALPALAHPHRTPSFVPAAEPQPIALPCPRPPPPPPTHTHTAPALAARRPRAYDAPPRADPAALRRTPPARSMTRSARLVRRRPKPPSHKPHTNPNPKRMKGAATATAQAGRRPGAQ